MISLSSFAGLIQFAPGFAPHPRISHVLFDFDGTLSLIREGWADVMTPMFLEMLPALPGETDEARRQLCWNDIMRLNGKQTIYQMLQLADRIKERGGTPRDALWYKREFLRRLDERIRSRLEGLRSGTLRPDDLLVHGARALLDMLEERRVAFYLGRGV